MAEGASEEVDVERYQGGDGEDDEEQAPPVESVDGCDSDGDGEEEGEEFAEAGVDTGAVAETPGLVGVAGFAAEGDHGGVGGDHSQHWGIDDEFDFGALGFPVGPDFEGRGFKGGVGALRRARRGGGWLVRKWF